MKPIESPESSSPIVTRAVAAALQNQFCGSYEFSAWQKAALRLLGYLPQSAGQFAISRFEMLSGLPPKSMDEFNLNDTLNLRLRDYDSLNGKFPAITVGVAQGGAAAALSVALDALFLPQAFVFTLKGGSKRGDVKEYLNRSLDRALQIADRNPGLMTIQHYDPIHDGWMTRYVNHLRIKLIDLPEAYAEFIRERLAPGGSIIYLEGGVSWLRYRLGVRSVFQVGGWGGIADEEFLSGSDRIRAYAKSAGMPIGAWRLNDYPLERGPESEWGSEPGLAEALEAFCDREGYRFVRIRKDQPHEFSRLTFNAMKYLIEKQGEEPRGVVVEMFSQFDTTALFKGSLIPLWLVFNTEDAYEFLKEMKPRFLKRRPIFFSPLSTFSFTPDIVPYKQWVDLLKLYVWINIGARESHYPADTRALVEWQKHLRYFVERNPAPIQFKLTVDELRRING
jgi:hypothetical protein